MTIALLLKSNNADGSTVFEDSSENDYSFGVNGGIAHSTDQSKWGASSIEVNALDKGFKFYLVALNTPVLTIDFWWWPDSAGSASGANIFHWTGLIRVFESGGDIYVQTGGYNTRITVDYDTYITEDDWNHIGLRFTSTDMYFYINGVQRGSSAWNFSSSINTTAHFYLGYDQGLGTYGKYGYYDEFCLHLDEAIDFSSTGVPTAEYSTVPTGVGAGDLQELTGSATLEEPTYGVGEGDLQEITAKAVAFSEENTIEYLVHSDTTDGSTTFDDAYGNYNVTAINTADHNTAQAKWGASGIRLFNGLDAVEASIPLTTDTFTIDFWFRPDYNVYESARKGIFSWRNIVLLVVETDDTLQLHVDGSLIDTPVAMSTYITAGTWHHIGITLDGGDVTLYIDGASIYSGTSALVSPNFGASQFRLGHDYAAGTAYAVKGFYDELCLHLDKAIDYSTNGVPFSAYGDPLPRGSAIGTLQELIGNAGAGETREGFVMGILQELLGSATGSKVKYCDGNAELQQLIGSATPAPFFSGNLQKLIGLANGSRKKIAIADGSLKELLGDGITYPVLFCRGSGELTILSGDGTLYQVITSAGSGSLKSVLGLGTGMSGTNDAIGVLQKLSGESSVINEIVFQPLTHSRGAIR
jgi:hypothetical protein